MRFDYTKGLKPRYIVSTYYEMTDDHCYFHYYKEAEAMFDKLKSTAQAGTRITLYDLVKDIRKKAARI